MRLCYYNGNLISIINRVDHIDYGRYYSGIDYFPSLNSINPCFTESYNKNDIDEIKKMFMIDLLIF